MQASAWCEILVGVLAPVVVITLMHIVRRRGVVLAHVGGILGILGILGSAGGTMIGLHSLFIVALAQDGGGAGNAALTRLDHIAPVPGAGFIQIALGLAAFGRISYRIIRMTDAEWESGPATGALPSPGLVTAPTTA